MRKTFTLTAMAALLAAGSAFAQPAASPAAPSTDSYAVANLGSIAPAAARLAGQVLDAAYGYNLGPVAFKPTLASGDTTFRTTREGALAYFVGGNSRFAGDTGFALKGWRSYEIDNAAIVINGTTAISIGNVMLTNSDGQVTTVDKTWGWVRDPNGGLRIVLHHSSLPYAPN